MRHISIRTTATSVVCVFVVACTDVMSPSTPAPIVKSVVPDTTEAGSILLHVVLNEPATVNVDYWTDDNQRLRLQVAQLASDGAILLPDVRAGKQYQFAVSAQTAGGAASPSLSGVIQTPALPPSLQQEQIIATGTSGSALTMLEINGPYRGFVAIDGAGYPVWRWATQGSPQGFTQRANGNFVFLDAGYGLFEVTPEGQVVHQLDPLPGGARVPHHDVVATPQNTLLFLAQQPTSATDTALVGDAIWEWSPENGTVVQRWSAFDFFDPAVDVGPRSLHYDWVHANSLAIGNHGNVILSLNWLDKVVSIAPDWKSLEWTAGGRNSTFAFDSGGTFQGQHAASTLPNGDLLLFDNGRDRTAADRYSRGLELSLDRTGGRAHVVWSFQPTPSIYAPYIGSARRLPNGNSLVFFGLRSGVSGSTGPVTGYEVSPSGAVVWQVSVTNVLAVYRATPLATIAGEVVLH